MHAPGISQVADRPHVPCGEAIPKNGKSRWEEVLDRICARGGEQEDGGQEGGRRGGGRRRIGFVAGWIRKIVECAVRCAEDGRTGF